MRRFYRGLGILAIILTSGAVCYVWGLMGIAVLIVLACLWVVFAK